MRDTLIKFHKRHKAAAHYLMIFIVAILAVVAANLTLFSKSNFALPNDWDYFNSLALVVRSTVLGYNTWPLHHPWVCGGLDLLSNPQNRIWSPFILTDVLLPPQMANIFYILVYGVLGFVGMAKLLKSQNTSWTLSLVGAAIYINGSWFGLHFYEGHVPFAAMQCLPWFAYFPIRIDQPKFIPISLLSLGIVILDSIPYSGFFAILATITALCVFPQARFNLTASTRSHKKIWILSIVALILMTLPKTIPVIATIGSRAPQIDLFTMSWQDMMTAFFNPTRSINHHLPSNHGTWRFHEFGCYFSVIALTLIAFAFNRRRKNISGHQTSFETSGSLIAMAIGFWLWTGTGSIPNLNPWLILHKIPFLNNMHVQSRVFIVAYLFFVILSITAMQQLKFSAKNTGIVCSVLLLESLIARNIPAAVSLQELKAPPGFLQLIQSKTIETTIDYAFAPEHYLGSPNVGTKRCYEPSFSPERILARFDTHYRGELWVAPEGSGRAELVSATPGRIEFKYAIRQDALVMFNANALCGWQIERGQGTLFGRGTELLGYAPSTPGSGEVVLRYQPQYLSGTVLGLIVGLMIFLRQILILQQKREIQQ